MSTSKVTSASTVAENPAALQLNIEGINFSGKMFEEIRYVQDPEIARMLLGYLDQIIDYILSPAPDVSDSARLDMVTALHNFSKFIKVILNREEYHE